jgi:hypothetical protein
VVPGKGVGCPSTKTLILPGILDPSGNPVCTGAVSGLQAVRI